MANFGEHTVYIFRDVLRHIQDGGSTATATDKGYLFGQWTSSFNPVVHGVLARWGNLKLEITDDVNDARDKLRDSYQLCLIGEVANARSSPNGRDRRQVQYEEPHTPGYLVLDITRELKALLYKTSRSFYPESLVGECRIEILQGGNPFTGIRVRELKTIADHHGNRRADHGLGAQNQRYAPNPVPSLLPTDEGRANLGQVARMGRIYESGGRDPETRIDQWYSSSQGQERLKIMHEGIRRIASDSKVEMKRDAVTHDMTFLFNSRGNKWEVAFPKDFPSGFLKLKENTHFGDNRPITITKRNIRPILEEIEDIVKKTRVPVWR